MHFPKLLLLAVLLLPAAQAAEPPAMSASAVRAAAEQVKADPLLPGSEKSKTLRLKERKEAKTDKAVRPDPWWLDALRQITGGLRVAVWLIGAALLIFVLLRLRDWLGQREGGASLRELPPTHVGTLDIRPQSLPADIGAAARALAQRGELRGALSLLYRGALSRLVHGHGVAIRAASTEQDCLRLAAPRLGAEARDFLALLIGCWRTVAYAGRQPGAEDVERLCTEFDRQLGVAP